MRVHNILPADEFDRHRCASEEFPPVISPAIIRSAVQSPLTGQAGGVDILLLWLSLPLEVTTLRDEDNHLDRLKEAGLDECGYRDDCWIFCKSCLCGSFLCRMLLWSRLSGSFSRLEKAAQ